MSRSIHLLIILICLCHLILLPSIRQSYRFERFQDEAGLKANTFYAIYQDSRGFLWFGSTSGLVRYDGYEFKLYKQAFNSDGLDSNTILSIFEDHQKILWVGTDRGLHRFNRNRERFEPFRVNDKKAIPVTSILCIFEDTEKRIWIGSEKGLFRIDHSRRTIRQMTGLEMVQSGLPLNPVRGIASDHQDRIWIISSIGISLLQRNNSRFLFYPLPWKTGNGSENTITAFAMDRDKEIWLGIRNRGLFRFDIETRTYRNYRDQDGKIDQLNQSYLFHILLDSDGVLWLSSISGLHCTHIKRRDWQTFLNRPESSHSISQNDVRVAYEDRNQNLWFGTFGGGLNKLNRSNLRFSTISAGSDYRFHLNNKMVWAICQDKQSHLWIGTDTGLSHWNKTEKRFYYYKDDDLKNVYNNMFISICEDSRDSLWIGTYGCGLKRFDRKTRQFKTFLSDSADPGSIGNNYVLVIFEDSRKTLLIGTRSGLNRLDRKTEKFSRILAKDRQQNRSGSNPTIFDIFEDSAGKIWLGTSIGLRIFNTSADVYEKHPEPQFSEIRVRIVTEDSEKRLILGTDSGIIILDRQSNTVRKIAAVDGLPDDNIRSIVPDDNNNIWIATNYGLCRLDLTKNRFLNYYRSDGLSGNQFNPRARLKTVEGNIYFGGMNGITYFSPDRIEKNKITPNIEITEFRLMDQVIIPGKDSVLKRTILDTNEIRLKHDQNFIGFKFTALDYINPKKNKYKFKLLGVDRNWVFRDWKMRYANYTGLEPGTYTFIVTGTNSDGVWSPVGRAIKITIAPPYWQTWWFRLIAVLALIILTVTLYRRRILKIEEKLRSENEVKALCDKYKLTRREQEIVQLILKGKNNREIEELLFISYNTIKNHIHNIFTKFAVKSRSDLVLFLTSTQQIKKK